MELANGLSFFKDRFSFSDKTSKVKFNVSDFTRKCEFFGAINPGRRAKLEKCKICSNRHPKIYNECIEETSVLLRTEVVVVDGKTIFNLVASYEEENQMDQNQMDQEKMTQEQSDALIRRKLDIASGRVSGEVVSGEVVSEPQVAPEVENTPPPQVNLTESKTVIIDGKETFIPKTGKGSRAAVVEVKGVLERAKQLVREGKNDQEVLTVLIEMYTSKGKTPKKAKHNSLSILFHAKKRVLNESKVVVAPVVVAPVVVAPDVVAPDVVAPDVVAPDVVAPDTAGPEGEMVG